MSDWQIWLVVGALITLGVVGLAFEYARCFWLAFRDKDQPFWYEEHDRR